ncbi:unnamed protein product [Mytilus coruscus]|uniref:Reverse transcriptase domain-containing protein n=1 Tax=Mytilus coruscus TaxID=42192 RepID=A0A6J8CU70_MYTCO|nr:unnamed protein product [Mytilus coruscus]
MDSFREFCIYLGMEQKDLENTISTYDGHSSEGKMLMALKQWKMSQLGNLKDPTLKDLSGALEKANIDSHLICQNAEHLYNITDQEVYINIELTTTLVVNMSSDFPGETPKIISPMGIISKPGGGIRLIHDCSRSEGSAVNDFAGDPFKQIFQTLDDATKLVKANCYIAKVDLKSAYRSVQISRASQQVTGFRWTFPDGREFTLFDRKLPFSSKLAPGIFHRLTQAVRRRMSREGFTIVAYLDEFFICEQTKSRCKEAFNELITLPRFLGFAINWSKVVDPCQQIPFLGVELDSTTIEVRLPGDKLAAACIHKAFPCF